MTTEEAALAARLGEWLEQWPEGLPARPSPPRTPFHWPPVRPAPCARVRADAWTGLSRISAYGELFPVETAQADGQWMGRVPGIWNEAAADTEAEMLDQLREGMEPLLRRQITIAEGLGLPGRWTRPLEAADAFGLLRLLFSPDRDVSICAGLEIEKRASSRQFGEALLVVLRSERHPWRRSAQWAALDMMEDPGAFFPSPEAMNRAVEATKKMMWDASDDYARAVYKAGVVLGGHFSTPEAGRALIECISAPSRIARRSAMHAVFHLNEWLPEMKEPILSALRSQAEIEPEPELADFALAMAHDIERESHDHVTEPLFAEEAWQ
jgi:hypothetical protein